VADISLIRLDRERLNRHEGDTSEAGDGYQQLAAQAEALARKAEREAEDLDEKYTGAGDTAAAAKRCTEEADAFYLAGQCHEDAARVLAARSQQEAASEKSAAATDFRKAAELRQHCADNALEEGDALHALAAYCRARSAWQAVLRNGGTEDDKTRAADVNTGGRLAAKLVVGEPGDKPPTDEELGKHESDVITAGMPPDSEAATYEQLGWGRGKDGKAAEDRGHEAHAKKHPPGAENRNAFCEAALEYVKASEDYAKAAAIYAKLGMNDAAKRATQEAQEHLDRAAGAYVECAVEFWETDSCEGWAVPYLQAMRIFGGQRIVEGYTPAEDARKKATAQVDKLFPPVQESVRPKGE
jgi:hypothetical protein